MRQLYQLYNQAPKRSIGFINNLQSLEAPISNGILSNYITNVIHKPSSIFLSDCYNDKERIVIENDKKKSIYVSPSINFNSYQTPPTSPTFCKDDKPKVKKYKSIGINTLKSDEYGNLNKFTANLLNMLIILFILTSFIGIIILLKVAIYLL